MPRSPTRPCQPGGLPVRHARGPAGPQRRGAGHGHAQRHARRRDQQPDEHRRRRPRRRPGPGRDPDRAAFARIASAGARRRATCSSSTSAAPARRAGCAARRSSARRSRPWRRSRAARSELGARPRLLPHGRQSVEDLEALRDRVGLRQARPLRRLLRHEGRARLRRAVPRPTSRRWCSTRSSCPTGRDPLNARPRCRPSGRVLADALRAAAHARAHHHDAARDLSRPRAPHGQGAAARHASTRRSARPSGRSLTASGLFDILLAGDLNPTLRAELPGSVRSALRGDPPAAAPARPRGRAHGRARRSRRAPAATLGAQGPATRPPTATRCSPPRAARRRVFPWDRNASPEAARDAGRRRPRARCRAASWACSRTRRADAARPIPLCVGGPSASPAPAPRRGRCPPCRR